MSRDVFWAGTLALIVEVAVVAVIFSRHRDAAWAAVAVGFPLAMGYILVHFTPARGWLSDSLLSVGSVVSIVAAGYVPRIRVEEAELTRALGDSYRDYARSTARLVPGLW